MANGNENNSDFYFVAGLVLFIMLTAVGASIAAQVLTPKEDKSKHNKGYAKIHPEVADESGCCGA